MTKIIAIISMGLFIILLTCLWRILPIFKTFPALTGKYHVGLTEMFIEDKNRAEQFGKNNLEKRSLEISILYPIDKAKGIRNPFLNNKMETFQNIVSSHYGIPVIFSKLLLRNIKTNSFLDATLSSKEKKYPVVLFSHGLLGFPSDGYMTLLEDLASHGYILVGINHPYFNIMTIQSNGSIVSSNKLAQKFEKMSQVEQKDFQTKAIDIYKSDLQFVLDQIALINQDTTSPFYDRLDLTNIGIMGHSAGGTAAIELCRIDKRCKAVIDLDGWYDQAIGYEPLQKPLLLLFSSKSVEVGEPTAEYLKRKELTRETYFEREKVIAEHRQILCKGEKSSMIILPEIAHEDFSDSILLKWPLRSWNEPDSYEAIKLINKSILRFFNSFLK